MNERITVFGGSQPRPGDDAYAQAEELGRLIGLAGFTVLTGGYIGTMEAVSKGAREAGGFVIGVTCEEIEEWRPVKPNQWINEELRHPTLRERLSVLIDECDAAIVLPGGIGTLAELAQMWSQVQVGAIRAKPIILVGADWLRSMEYFFGCFDRYISLRDRDHLTFVKSGAEAVAVLKTLLTR